MVWFAIIMVASASALSPIRTFGVPGHASSRTCLPTSKCGLQASTQIEHTIPFRHEGQDCIRSNLRKPHTSLSFHPQPAATTGHKRAARNIRRAFPCPGCGSASSARRIRALVALGKKRDERTCKQYVQRWHALRKRTGLQETSSFPAF